MNLNLLTLFAPATLQPPSAGSSGGASSLTSGSSSSRTLGDVVFGQLLAAQLQRSGASAPVPGTGLVTISTSGMPARL